MCSFAFYTKFLCVQPEPYFLDGSPILDARCHRDLGVLVDLILKFHLHISDVVQKAGGTCCIQHFEEHCLP